jgi:two-component system, NarL family, response regulator DesR
VEVGASSKIDKGSSMHILIADKQSSVRSALALLLREQAAVGQVGAINRKDQVIPAVETLKPDLILLDWELVDEHTLTALRRLASPPLIVVLSSQPEAQEKAQAAGVDAFISKCAPPDEVIETLRRILNGNI